MRLKCFISRWGWNSRRNPLFSFAASLRCYKYVHHRNAGAQLQLVGYERLRHPVDSRAWLNSQGQQGFGRNVVETYLATIAEFGKPNKLTPNRESKWAPPGCSGFPSGSPQALLRGCTASTQRKAATGQDGGPNWELGKKILMSDYWGFYASTPTGFRS